ncbi:MAG: serine/threonine-protein kinase, partial [Brachybacterium sp.]
IHRDVKPANIMFEPRGRAHPASRLADFGIAVHETDVRFTHVGMVNGTPGYMAPELFSMAEPTPSHDLYAAGVVALVALNGPIKLHDGAFRPDELNQYLRGVTPKLSAVIRRLVAAQPEDRYQDAETVRRDLPRVPQGYPLAHADGAPLEFVDTLDPLPENAPGAARPERPAPPVAPSSLEAIRAGQVQQGFSSGSPSPQTGPQWAQQTPPGSPPQQGAHFTPHGFTAAQTSTGPTGQGGAGSRGTLIAVALGVVAALVLGVITAAVLLMVFDGGSASAMFGGGEGPVSSIDAAFAEVEPGQECIAEDEGVIALTAEGDYVSCTTDPGGEGLVFA